MRVAAVLALVSLVAFGLCFDDAPSGDSKFIFPGQAFAQDLCPEDTSDSTWCRPLHTHYVFVDPDTQVVYVDTTSFRFGRPDVFSLTYSDSDTTYTIPGRALYNEAGQTGLMPPGTYEIEGQDSLSGYWLQIYKTELDEYSSRGIGSIKEFPYNIVAFRVTRFWQVGETGPIPVGRE